MQTVTQNSPQGYSTPLRPDGIETTSRSHAFQKAELWIYENSPEAEGDQRNAAAIAIAIKLRGLDVSRAEAIELLERWNCLYCEPGMAAADLRAAVIIVYEDPTVAPVPSAHPTKTPADKHAARGASAAVADTKLAAALEAVRRGFRVFPVVEGAKNPAIGNWQNLATTDESQIRKWWTERPNCNIGTPTDGLLVFDIDKDKGGLDTWNALVLQYEFPKTLRTITARGGAHIIYSRPEHTSVRNSASELGPGLDIRADGGLIVLPGSVFQSKPYVWANDQLLTIAPADIIALGKARRPKTAAAGKRVVEEDETALDMAWAWLQNHAPRAELGALKDTAYRVACQLYDYGLNEDSCRQFLREWGNSHCNPRLEDDTVESTARHALRYRGNAVGSKHPGAHGFEPAPVNDRPHVASPAKSADWSVPSDLWSIDDRPPELPDGALPEIVDCVARDRAQRLGVAPGAPAAALVTVLASLVPAGNRLQMRQRDPDWMVKPILWTAIIGLPGSNKSATISSATAVAQVIESKWRKEFIASEARHREVERLLEQRKGKPESAEPEADSNSAVNPDEVFAGIEPKKPRFRQKLFNDATIEALAASLSENPAGVLYHADELAGWLGSMDAYRAKGGKDRPFWLQAKEGGPYTVNRRTSDRICVDNLAVSILGGIQPEKIKKLGVGMTDDGLLQRFAPILIERIGNGCDIDPIPGLAERLQRAAFDIVESEQGADFRFSPEANAELEAIESFKAREISRPDSSPSLQQWLEKLPNEFGRVALAFHFIEWHGSAESVLVGGNPPPLISHATAYRARRYVTEFTYRHARVFYQKDLGRSEIEDHAAWVAGFILARGRAYIDERDVYRSYPALRHKDRRGDIAAAMRVLEMNDWAKPTKSRGDQATAWAINPAVHDGRFTKQAELERSRRLAIRETIAKEAEEQRTVQSP